MRPVNRLAKPASYPVQIRLDTLAHLRTDASAISWNFNARTVYNVFGKYTVSAWEVFEALLQLAKAGKKRSKALDAIRDAKGTLDRQISNNYKLAQDGLINQYGPYCNYCDQRLPGEIDVEHCIPKAPYPYFCLSWDNFLFACKACNIVKSDDPERKYAIQWANPNTGEVDLYDAIRSHYLWADTDATTYQDMPPQLAYYDTGAGQWTALSASDSVLVSNAITSRDVPNREIKADLTVGGVKINADVMVQLDPQNVRAQETVEYVELNRLYSPTSDSIADRRVYNRTLAWFNAVHAFEPLVNNLTQARYEATWPLITQLAINSGFFCVWVRVLALLGGTASNVPSGNPNPPTLSKQFLDDITANGGYTNTNTTNLPA